MARVCVCLRLFFHYEKGGRVGEMKFISTTRFDEIEKPTVNSCAIDSIKGCECHRCYATRQSDRIRETMRT